MKHLKIILFLIAFLATMCWDIQSQVSSPNQAFIVQGSFKIISEKEHVDPKFGINKCNLEIELKSKLTKEEITLVANYLRSTRVKYDRLWISYYLSTIKDRSFAWATSNFNPNLVVDIIGISDIDLKKSNSGSVLGKIGKWKDERPYVNCEIILFSKENNIFMKLTCSDGSTADTEFLKKSVGYKIIYQPKDNPHKEYYVIEKNGNLGMYGENGKFSEAKKIQ